MLKVSTTLLDGRPAEKIVQVAEEKNFGIIIMGSRGLGSVKELFLGSVSDKVADTSTMSSLNSEMKLSSPCLDQYYL